VHGHRVGGTNPSLVEALARASVARHRGELTWSAVLTRYEALLDAPPSARPRRTPATGPPDRET
jgi:hypothetical protein